MHAGNNWKVLIHTFILKDLYEQYLGIKRYKNASTTLHYTKLNLFILDCSIGSKQFFQEVQ
jgi:hypothetical protein